ncbi:MAG: hypothetical protein IH960_07290 [Chloroflexi bacterium]|nr:hypothetical protein [Chloroflexota bacterium]
MTGVLGFVAESARPFWRLMVVDRFNTAIAIGLLLISSLVTLNLLISNAALNGATIASLAPMANFIHGNGYTLAGEPSLFWPPGYGLLGLPVYVATGDIEAAGVSVSIMGYIGVVLAGYFAGRFLVGHRAGLLSAGAISLTQVVVELASSLLVDIAFAALYVGVFALVVRGYKIRFTPLLVVVLGLLVGIAYLARPEGIALIVMVPAVMLTRVWLSRVQDSTLGQTVRHVTIFLIVVGIIVSPYALFLHANTGEWSISGKTSFTLYAGEELVYGRAHIDQLWESHPEYFAGGASISIPGYILGNKDTMPRRIMLNLIALTKALVFSTALPAGLVLLALMLGFQRDRRRGILQGIRPPEFHWNGWAITTVAFVIPSVGLLLFSIEPRYATPYAVVLIIALASLASHVVFATNSRSRSSIYHTLLLVTVLVFVVIPRPDISLSIPKSIFDISRLTSQYLPPKAAGEWLRTTGSYDAENLILIGSGGVDFSYYYAVGHVPAKSSTIRTEGMNDICEVVDRMLGFPTSVLVLYFDKLDQDPGSLAVWSDQMARENAGLEIISPLDGSQFRAFQLRPGARCRLS